jgi:hypothetical protein
MIQHPRYSGDAARRMPVGGESLMAPILLEHGAVLIFNSARFVFAPDRPGRPAPRADSGVDPLPARTPLALPHIQKGVPQKLRPLYRRVFYA